MIWTKLFSRDFLPLCFNSRLKELLTIVNQQPANSALRFRTTEASSQYQSDVWSLLMHNSLFIIICCQSDTANCLL